MADPYADSDIYFAALPDNQIGDALQARVDEYYDYLRDSIGFARQTLSWQRYYGVDDRGWSSSLVQGGESGEVWSASPNRYRTLLQRVLTLTTSARLNFETRALNSDSASLATSRVVRGQIDDYLKRQGLEDQLYRAQEMNQLLGEVTAYVEWDPMAGEVVAIDPETNAAIRAGDNLFKMFMPVDVIRDANQMDAAPRWRILREWVNKYDEAAKYPPEIAAKILALSAPRDMCLHYYESDPGLRRSQACWVPMYTFIHDRTPACPAGRIVTFFGPDIVCRSLPLPYSEIPCRTFTLGEMYGTWQGYTNSFDALGANDLHNAMLSAITSNNMNQALQLLWLPEGSQITPEQVLGGASVIYGRPGEEPKPLNLTSSSPETFKTMDIAGSLASEALGMNDLAMGKLPYAGIPAELQAQMTSLAVQFNQSSERAYANMAQWVVTRALKNIGEFADTKRRVRMLGQHGEQLVESYNPGLMRDLDEVVCTLASPTERTAAGQQVQIQSLMQAQTPEQLRMIRSILSTGTYEPVSEPESDLELLLKWEREQLSDPAMPVPPSTPFDDHILHIENAKTVVRLPHLRQDPQIVRRVADYILQAEKAQQEAMMLGLVMPPMPPSAPGAPPTEQPAGPVPAG